MTTESRPGRDWHGMAYAVGFVALGIVALASSGDMSALGAVFPRTIATAMIVFSLGYIAQNLFRPAGKLPPGDGGSWGRRAALVAVMLGWIALLPWLGFLVSGMLGFLGMILVGNYDAWTPRRVATYALTSVAIIGGFFVLFAVMLNVPLPEAALF